MTDINREFCKECYHRAVDELRARLGRVMANVLLKKHMDVGGSGDYYYIHWVKCPPLFDHDLYGSRDSYVKTDNLWDAREKAVRLLLDELERKNEWMKG